MFLSSSFAAQSRVAGKSWSWHGTENVANWFGAEAAVLELRAEVPAGLVVIGSVARALGAEGGAKVLVVGSEVVCLAA